MRRVGMAFCWKAADAMSEQHKILHLCQSATVSRQQQQQHGATLLVSDIQSAVRAAGRDRSTTTPWKRCGLPLHGRMLRSGREKGSNSPKNKGSRLLNAVGLSLSVQLAASCVAYYGCSAF